MHSLKKTLSVLSILLLVLLCAEVGARVFIDQILKRSPAFRLDPVVGWRPARLSDPAQGAGSEESQRLAVIGDSFVFGEGVRLEDRFDRRMKDAGFSDELISLGVSGFATDQEMLASETRIALLREGDTVILVTFGDDFRGLLSDFFAGRHKPRYRKEDGRWIMSPPAIGFLDIAVDRSYLVRMVRNRFFPKKMMTGPFDMRGLDEALTIYDRLLTEYLKPAFERGVKIGIIFHGQKNVDEDFGQGMGRRVDEKLRGICQKHSFAYVNADPDLDDSRYRQPGNVHWNALGHQKFAEILMRTCDKSNNQIHLSQKESS